MGDAPLHRKIEVTNRLPVCMIVSAMEGLRKKEFRGLIKPGR